MEIAKLWREQKSRYWQASIHKNGSEKHADWGGRHIDISQLTPQLRRSLGFEPKPKDQVVEPIK